MYEFQLIRVCTNKYIKKRLETVVIYEISQKCNVKRGKDKKLPEIFSVVEIPGGCVTDDLFSFRLHIHCFIPELLRHRYETETGEKFVGYIEEFPCVPALGNYEGKSTCAQLAMLFNKKLILKCLKNQFNKKLSKLSSGSFRRHDDDQVYFSYLRSLVKPRP